MFSPISGRVEMYLLTARVELLSVALQEVLPMLLFGELDGDLLLMV